MVHNLLRLCASFSVCSICLPRARLPLSTVTACTGASHGSAVRTSMPKRSREMAMLSDHLSAGVHDPFPQTFGQQAQRQRSRTRTCRYVDLVGDQEGGQWRAAGGDGAASKMVEVLDDAMVGGGGASGAEVVMVGLEGEEEGARDQEEEEADGGDEEEEEEDEEDEGESDAESEGGMGGGVEDDATTTCAPPTPPVGAPDPPPFLAAETLRLSSEHSAAELRAMLRQHGMKQVGRYRFKVQYYD